MQNNADKITGSTVVVIRETSLLPKRRVPSIDILRGTVMLIMALDHVRDYFHVHAWDQNPTDLATTTPSLFFTRWITHFCAPVFVLLSGTSAFLSGQKKTKKELSLFLIKRGLWLVFIEMTLVTLAWTFDPLFHNIILQVIWAIGWSMIVLGVLVRTNMTVILVTGAVLFFGHNVLDYASLPREGAAATALNILLSASFSFYHYGQGRLISVIYAILPWTGTMLLGYGLGHFYRASFDPQKRKKTLIALGISLTLLFILLRALNGYGDPAPWSQQKTGVFTFLSFLNVTKYPASLMYFSMTLGPMLLVLAFTENVQNRFSRILTTYGRVPFFYYVLHLYFMHLICVILFFSSGYNVSQAADLNVPFLFRPLTFGYDLWTVYLIWLFVIIVLYFPCRWFNHYKSNHNHWWLSYI